MNVEPLLAARQGYGVGGATTSPATTAIGGQPTATTSGATDLTARLDAVAAAAAVLGIVILAA